MCSGPVPAGSTMDLLVFVLVALIILALLGWALSLIPMDQTIRTIVMVLAILICILIILRRLGYV